MTQLPNSPNSEDTPIGSLQIDLDIPLTAKDLKAFDEFWSKDNEYMTAEQFRIKSYILLVPFLKRAKFENISNWEDTLYPTEEELKKKEEEEKAAKETETVVEGTVREVTEETINV